jgi:hypothetical protein
MCGAIPPLPQYVFMAWCLVTFTFSTNKKMTDRGDVPQETGVILNKVNEQLQRKEK